MKINKTTGVGSTQAVNRINKSIPVEGSSFSSLMGERQESQTREELEQMMRAIKEEGDKLVDEKNIDVLINYKKKIKSFVSRAVDFAFEIQDKKGITRFGRGKILKIVSQVDDVLVEITQQFLDEERSRIKLLARVGELQGLLYNIYA